MIGRLKYIMRLNTDNIMTYEEFLKRLGLQDGKMASLLWDLYQQCRREEQNNERTDKNDK